jgi:uncharacterized protein YbjT (DUF2867 family)
VGQEVLAALLADESYSAVHTVGRRRIAQSHPKLHSHVVDFTALDKMPEVNDVFICLGTTIKVAGSQAAFRAVDYEAVVALAGVSIAQGATKLGVVSAMGADPQSSVFYNRVKGEMEAAVCAMGFQTVVIARPSMLAGNREALAQAPRLGEQIGLKAMKVFSALIPDDYKAIEAAQVAKALVHLVATAPPGITIASSAQLRKV